MLKSLVFGAVVAMGLASSANAGILVMPLDNSDSAVVRVAEGCGAGWFRGPGGHCHPMPGPGGSLRGTRFACPPGMHIGPYGHRCWPNH